MALFELDEINTKSIEKSIEPKEKSKHIHRTVSYDELIHMNKKLKSLDYPEFTSENYPYGLVFYDFEVFEYDRLVVLIDPIHKTKDVICNNRPALKEYYELHKDMIWVGYNNMHYDVPILKTILNGNDPKVMSDAIIIEGKKPYDVDSKINKIPLLSYDVAAKLESLKLLEAYMGDDIEETEVSFDIDRPLTQDEINMTVKYCIHDVEETIEVFVRRISDFNAQIALIETFNLGIKNVSRTKGQLTAMIVDCERQSHDDEFDITIVPTLQLNKYSYIKDWFITACKNKDYSAKLETMVAGVPHQFGWGGVHGAPNEPLQLTGKIYHCDVTSYYPSLMIVYKFLTRNSKHPEKFKDVYDTRVALKKAGKKKESDVYKIVINSQYGITKDKFSEAYDPVQANNICINGQLLLLDLLEKLEYRLGEHFKLIQSNTDGIIVWIDDEERSEKIMRHIIKSWCERTKMGMGIDEISFISQANVNNYIFKFANGKLERKGAMVMELDDLSYNLPIVNEAMVEYIINGTPVEKTVNECNDFIKFQQVFRMTSSYKYAYYNGEYLHNKTFRVFASKDKSKSTLLKCKYPIGAFITKTGEVLNKGEESGKDGRYYKGEKFQNCPEHCFIFNKEIKNMPVPEDIDRNWYIEIAKKRLIESFGYQLKTGGALF